MTLIFMCLKVYDHEYRAVLDGVETESVMEIDPAHRIEIFKMGIGSDEVLEVHDFENVSINNIHTNKFTQSVCVR